MSAPPPVMLKPASHSFWTPSTARPPPGRAVGGPGRRLAGTQLEQRDRQVVFDFRALAADQRRATAAGGFERAAGPQIGVAEMAERTRIRGSQVGSHLQLAGSAVE